MPPGHPTDITEATVSTAGLTKNTGLLENKLQFVIETLLYVAYILHR